MRKKEEIENQSLVLYDVHDLNPNLAGGLLISSLDFALTT